MLEKRLEKCLYILHIKLLTDLLVEDDDSGDSYREALNQIERFRMMIKNKYRNPSAHRDEIKKVLNSLRELPAMPNVVTKALGAIKNPNSGAKDLAKIVARYTGPIYLKVVNFTDIQLYIYERACRKR